MLRFALRLYLQDSASDRLPEHVPCRGSPITVPLSQNQIVHINAYAPPGSFKEYEKVYEQMIASIRIQQGGYR